MIWAGLLSAYYLVNPCRCCEAIVARWRRAVTVDEPHRLRGRVDLSIKSIHFFRAWKINKNKSHSAYFLFQIHDKVREGATFNNLRKKSWITVNPSASLWPRQQF
jgi:hypothetical protein